MKTELLDLSKRFFLTIKSMKVWKLGDILYRNLGEVIGFPGHFLLGRWEEDTDPAGQYSQDNLLTLWLHNNFR